MKKKYVVVLVLVSLFGGYQACNFFAHDACLDAGGAWDAARGICVGVE